MSTLHRAPEQQRVRPQFAGLLIGIPVLFLVLSTIGALSESTVPGIPVVPWVTLWSLPLDLWIRDLATALTIGFILIGGVIAPRPDKRSGSLASIAAVVWLVSLCAQSVLTVSEVLALPLSTSLDPTIVWSLLTQTTLGRVILIQMALVGLTAILAWVTLDRMTGSILLGAALIAAFLPGFNGHSGIDDGHSSATISLGIHIIAASVWIGGLVAVVDYCYRHGPNSERVLRTFSLLALISVIVIAESGLLNAGLRLDGFASIVTSPYGAILLAKIAVLIALIGYGWRQRRNIADRFVTEEGRTRVLVQLSAVELAWMGMVLGLSVALSRTAPPGYALAGDPLGLASTILLAIGIPLAIVKSLPEGRRPRVPGWLRQYPEPAAVLLLAAMAALASAASASLLGPQILGLVTIIVLIALGVVMWAAVDGLPPSKAIVPLLIVALGLPFIAWWIEQGIVGGLGWTSVVAVGMGWAILALGIPRKAKVAA